MKIIGLQQRTPEWHQWRNTGVSASEAVVVLGLCPYKTPYRLYTEKKGITLPDNLDSNPFVQRGIQLEMAARQSFERRYGTLLLPMCGESDEHPFLRASFDGIDDDGIPVVTDGMQNLADGMFGHGIRDTETGRKAVTMAFLSLSVTNISYFGATYNP